MKIEVYDSATALAKAGAARISEVIRNKPDAVVCMASGHSPRGIFEELIHLSKQGLDFGKVQFIGLDEWEHMNGGMRGSCRQMMDEDFFVPAGIRPDQIHFFDGCAPDPVEECNRIQQQLMKFGGLDLMLVGIGINGHIAMNEPGSDFSAWAHVSELHPSTIATGQKYFDQPTALSRGLTLGLGNFREARVPMLVALGSSKSVAIAAALQQPVSPEVPASVLQLMPTALVLLDTAAAAGLSQPTS